MHPRARFESRALSIGLAVVLAALAGYTVHRATVLRVEYWDGFLYLNNARAITGDATATYTFDKPPLVPLLYAPVIEHLEDRPPAGIEHVTLPHAVAAALTLLSLLAVFLALRVALGTTLGLAGAVLFAGNRLFVRYGAHVLADYVPTGLATAAVGLWLFARRRDRWRWYALAGLPMGAAMASRYNLVLLPFVFVVGELMLAAWERRIADRRVLGLVLAGGVAAAVFLGLHYLAYTDLPREFGLRTLLDIFEYGSANTDRELGEESPLDYWTMANVAVSPLLLVVASGGMVLGLFRQDPNDVIFGGCFLAFAVPILMVAHTEIRYLLPALPAVAYFALAPFEVATRRFRDHEWTRRRDVRGALVGFGIAALLLSLLPAVDQIRRDRDPFFRTDVQRAVAAWAIEHRGPGGRVVFHGRPFSLHPDDPLVFPQDEFFDVFHFADPALEFMTGERIELLRYSSAPAPLVLARQERPGDAVVMGPDRDYRTPDLMTPLAAQVPRRVEVWAADRLTLAREADTEPFRSGDGLEVRARDTSLTANRAVGPVHVFSRSTATSAPRLLGEVDLQAGRAVTLSTPVRGRGLLLLRARHATF